MATYCCVSSRYAASWLCIYSIVRRYHIQTEFTVRRKIYKPHVNNYPLFFSGGAWMALLPKLLLNFESIVLQADVIHVELANIN